MPLSKYDPRLMTAARALELAGDWPVFADVQYADLDQFEPEHGGPRQPGRWQANLRCMRCQQSCGQLGAQGDTVATDIADLMAGVLRHMAMAHDVPLKATAATQSAVIAAEAAAPASQGRSLFDQQP